MPGPATLYTAAQTLALGKRGGLLAALGLHAGGYVHVIAAAFGLSALFKVIPILYTIMKLAGAVYLVWLGVKLFLNRQPLLANTEQAVQKTTFWQSVTVEILNPKTVVFYVAFLPQFTDVGASLPLWVQLLILGTIVNILFSSADVVCVFLAEKLSTTLKNSASSTKIAGRIGGAILIALAVNLAISK